MSKWDEVVNICKDNYKKSCYDCPIWEACFERIQGQKRSSTAKEYEANVIAYATEKGLIGK